VIEVFRAKDLQLSVPIIDRPTIRPDFSRCPTTDPSANWEVVGRRMFNRVSSLFYPVSSGGPIRSNSSVRDRSSEA
jgi:hypothetical protein